MSKVVVFTTVAEAGTGLALLVDPAAIVTLLLGMPADTTVQAAGRCFGISLLALAAAWWPDRAVAASVPSWSRGRLIYNAGIALFLAYLGAVGHMGGLLLWPVVAVHAVVSLLLVTTRWVHHPD